MVSRTIERSSPTRGGIMRKTALTTALLVTLGCMLLPREALAVRTTVCPNVTCQGGIPKFSVSGARGLSHPDIVPIFWGSYWATATTARGQMVGALQAMVNGPYFGAINQYGGSTGTTVGPARMTPMAP